MAEHAFDGKVRLASVGGPEHRSDIAVAASRVAHRSGLQ